MLANPEFNWAKYPEIQVWQKCCADGNVSVNLETYGPLESISLFEAALRNNEVLWMKLMPAEKWFSELLPRTRSWLLFLGIVKLWWKGNFLAIQLYHSQVGYRNSPNHQHCWTSKWSQLLQCLWDILWHTFWCLVHAKSSLFCALSISFYGIQLVAAPS